jgi:steroid delta-isomerase-like uncharacterized protein
LQQFFQEQLFYQVQGLKQYMTALEVVSNYIAALTEQDCEAMERHRTADFVLDWVHGDAYNDGNPSARHFWPVLFAGFPEMDYEVTRTIAAETVVVTQWTFTGTHSEPLAAPLFEPALAATGRTIRWRGVSVFDVAGDLIQRETTYIDLATLLVELGVEL